MTRRVPTALFVACLLGVSGSSHAATTPTMVTPEVFEPESISAPGGVDCLTFTPDGNTVLFDVEGKHSVTIMESHRVHGSWSTPKVASFSGTWMDHDPVVAPDGSYLVYTSNRPDAEGGQPMHGGHLWRVDRRGDTWSTPTRFPDAVNATTRTFAPAVAANGDVYYQQADPPRHDYLLYRTQRRDGTYGTPALVELGEAKAHKLDPAIAPDGSFIVFDANYADKSKPDRLYIAFRDGDHWRQPIDMGDALNQYQPWGSHLSPDHRTLYFTSDHALPGNVSAAAHQGSNHIWRVSLTPWLDAG
jgi:Tol biopolymer transport system component